MSNEQNRRNQMSIWSDEEGTLRVMYGTRPDGKPRACLVCGGRPNAIWVGEDILTVCRKCAIDVLPRIMADATAGVLQGCVASGQPMEVRNAMRSAWARAESLYWQAAAHAMAMLFRRPKS